jgi:uncharacterized cupredoxin-like copper-binding protein
MKHLMFWSVSSILLILLFAACGGSTTTSGTSTATPGSSTTMSGAQHVEITENEYTIVSSISTFTAGVPYHFAVKNTGKTAHELMIMPKDEGPMGNMSMDHMDGIALAKTGDINAGAITL